MIKNASSLNESPTKKNASSLFTNNCPKNNCPISLYNFLRLGSLMLAVQMSRLGDDAWYGRLWQPGSVKMFPTSLALQHKFERI